MNPTAPPAGTPPASTPLAGTPPDVDPTEARLRYLFRTTQREGRIHPLLHLLQQHRASQAGAAKEPA